MNSKLRLKTLLVTGLLMLSSLGCEKSASPAAPNTDALEFEEGGISGGGGGTLPANPIGTYRVVEIVGGAKRFLRLYFNYERKYDRGPTTQKDRFFYGPENLAAQLEKTNIEILMDKPCRNRFGKPVDASIHASRPNTICISAQRIAPKLIEENANKEIVALLAHELSHFLGSSEKEAQELQKWVAIRIDEVSFKEASQLEARAWDFSNRLEGALRMRDDISAAIKAQDWPKLTQRLKDLFYTLATYEDEWGLLPFATVDFPIREFEDIMEAKVNLALTFMQGQDTSDKHGEYFRDEYEKCFGSDSVITARDLAKRCFRHLADSIYGDYQMRKLNSPEEILRELKDVFLYADELGDHARAIAFDQPLPFFNLPTNQMRNPWENFVGSYQVLAEPKCITSGKASRAPHADLRQLEIRTQPVGYPVDLGEQIYVTEKGETWSQSNSVYNGASGYAGNVRVHGDANKAHLSSERGSRWYDRQGHGWSQITRTLERLPNGKFAYTLTSEFFKYGWSGTEGETASCQFTLERVN